MLLQALRMWKRAVSRYESPSACGEDLAGAASGMSLLRTTLRRLSLLVGLAIVGTGVSETILARMAPTVHRGLPFGGVWVFTSLSAYGHLLPGSRDEVRERMDAYLAVASESAAEAAFIRVRAAG
jgi:hypothetical protein